MFSLSCTWTNSWANNGDAGDLRRHHAHYDAIVKLKFDEISFGHSLFLLWQNTTKQINDMYNSWELLHMDENEKNLYERYVHKNAAHGMQANWSCSCYVFTKCKLSIHGTEIESLTRFVSARRMANKSLILSLPCLTNCCFSKWLGRNGMHYFGNRHLYISEWI